MAKKTLVELDMTGKKIINLSPGIASTDAATLGQIGAGGGAPQNLFIQNSAPASPPAKYMWVQTGLGDSGVDTTFWIEDGLV